MHRIRRSRCSSGVSRSWTTIRSVGRSKVMSPCTGSRRITAVVIPGEDPSRREQPPSGIVPLAPPRLSPSHGELLQLWIRPGRRPSPRSMPPLWGQYRRRARCSTCLRFQPQGQPYARRHPRRRRYGGAAGRARSSAAVLGEKSGSSQARGSGAARGRRTSRRGQRSPRDRSRRYVGPDVFPAAGSGRRAAASPQRPSSPPGCTTASARASSSTGSVHIARCHGVRCVLLWRR